MSATLSSTTLVEVPTQTPDPNFGHLLIINDVLYPKDSVPYTPAEIHERLCLFVLSQLVPIVSSLLLIFSRKGWWRRKFYWTMNRMMVLWLISIQVFGAIVYFQKGATTRILFISAIIHLQVEYMILALFLKQSGLRALVVAYIGGTILFGIPLFVKDLSLVFMLTTVAGFSDFAMPLLLTYGKQWLYATAAWAHGVQVVAVFIVVIKNYGTFWWDFITFWSTWIQNGAIVAALFRAWLDHHNKQPIRLVAGDDQSEVDKLPGGEAPDNPLANVDISKKAAIIIFAISIASTFTASWVFVFVIARN